MRPLSDWHRGRWAAGAIVLAGLVGVIGAGLGTVRPRAYVLRAPNQYQLVVLTPGRSVCEGPVTSSASFRGVAVWGAVVGPAAALRLSVRTSSGRRSLAAGTTVAWAAGAEQGAGLDATVPAGVAVRVCVTDLRGGFLIAGSPVINHHIIMTGGPAHRQFSLLLLGAPRSLFSTLPTIFSRAALFRPGWVGAWTFWVLSAGLLGTFALALVAVARALKSDSEIAEQG